MPTRVYNNGDAYEQKLDLLFHKFLDLNLKVILNTILILSSLTKKRIVDRSYTLCSEAYTFVTPQRSLKCHQQLTTLSIYTPIYLNFPNKSYL